MDEKHGGRHPLVNAKPSSSKENYPPSERSNENAYVDIPEDTESQEPPSLESLSKDPDRTHRKWYPKYGRVQKCDWCNARARGTLQVCTTCAIRMCEDCARGRLWHGNRLHFIDADTLDWVMKKVARAPKPKQPKPPKPAKPAKKVPAKRAASASSDEEPKTPPPAPRRRKLKAIDYNEPEDEDDEDGEDDGSAGHGNNSTNAGPKQAHFPAPQHPQYGFAPHPPPPVPNYYGYNQEALHHHQAPMHGGYAPYGRMEPPMPGYYGPPVPAPAVPSMAGPSTHPDGRRAATKAKLNNTEQSRRTSGSRLDDDGNETGGGEDSEFDPQQDENDNEVKQKKGHADDANNNSNHGHSDRSATRTHARTLSRTSTDHNGTSSQVNAAHGIGTPAERLALTTRDREHDRLVVDVYNWLYGDRPALDPNRVRTRIPDRQASVPQYHREASPYGDGPYPAPHPAHPYGHPHQHMYPPGPGYPQYPPHQPYPEHPSYRPTAAHAPTPQDLTNIEHDQAMLDQMVAAWAHNPILQQLVAGNHRVYAVQLLWEVFGLRRWVVVREGRDGRNTSGDSNNGNDDDAAVDDGVEAFFPRTVCWFVAERDSQFRMEHEYAHEYAQRRVGAQTLGYGQPQPQPQVQVEGQGQGNGQAQQGPGGHGHANGTAGQPSRPAAYRGEGVAGRAGSSTAGGGGGAASGGGSDRGTAALSTQPVIFSATPDGL
ncbi:hypothetical protein B0I37DRAFT_406761 [Chaetomium sp. MPI-CAGE-AT-0009]|nr:hypothetical protein B0I37DRAFT_406761 [Chaetomium sp. MPI-CAGE-AT-0009]